MIAPAMNLRRVRQHEVEDAGEIGHGAHDQRGPGDFLARLARHGDAALDHQGGQQQHAEQGASGEPAEGN